MNCAKCGKEILDKESSFCAYCGSPFDSKPKSADLVTGAGILAIIAAIFSIAVGVIGVVSYQTYVDYYPSYDPSTFIGFVYLGIFSVIASVFGGAGGMLVLSRKRFKVSVVGILVMLASAVFTFIIVWQYGYGFTDSILLSGISVGALSIASAVFAIKSKSEFA